jgi:hypothetical protein
MKIHRSIVIALLVVVGLWTIPQATFGQVVKGGEIPGYDSSQTRSVRRGYVCINPIQSKPFVDYPLYVIDGVIMDIPEDSIKANRYSPYDPLAAIDVETIESIEILKNADATALHDSNGVHDVILITTKKRKKR